MLNFALMGAGRIGKMHANNIASHHKCNLSYVFDINKDFANQIARFTVTQKGANPPWLDELK